MTNTLKLQAEFGQSPVGSEVVETESYWDDHGFKNTYEFTLVPSDKVAIVSEWQERECVAGFRSALAEMDDPTLVVRFTISCGGSFSSTTWMRFPEAHALLVEFLAGVVV